MRGLVHFSARRATAEELAAEGLPSEEPLALVPEEEKGAVKKRLDLETVTTHKEREAEAPGWSGLSQGGGWEGRDRRQSQRPSGLIVVEEKTLLEVEAKVCRSILSADITELQFLEACPGALYVKEFSVWNK